MKNQLLYLRQLQAIDTKTKTIQQSILAVPGHLAPAKHDLQKLEKMLEQEREKIEETERWRQEQEAIVQREEEALKNAKAKLAEAKNARDFGAASREVDNKKRSIHDREQEVLRVYSALEVGRAKLATHEEDVAKLRAHVESEEAKFADQLHALKEDADQAVEGRAEIVEKIDSVLLKRYTNVSKMRAGVAVVSALRGVCQGCHMALPPQIANQLVRGESLQNCRQCNRLLYLEEEEQSEEEQ